MIKKCPYSCEHSPKRSKPFTSSSEMNIFPEFATDNQEMMDREDQNDLSPV